MRRLQIPPNPLHLLGYSLDEVPAFCCGCGRDRGCIEAYSTISGLPQFLDFIGGIRQAVLPCLFPKQHAELNLVPVTLAQLSKSIGAARVALYSP